MFLKSLELLTSEGSKIKASPNNSSLISSDFSPATSGIREAIGTLMDLCQKVHLVIQLDFSLVPLPQKIMGQFKVIVTCSNNIVDLFVQLCTFG